MRPPTDVFREFHLLPPEASTMAASVDFLMAAMVILCVLVAGGIFSCLAWFCWKYRRGSPADRAPEVGPWFSTLVELTWTFIPLAVFMGFFAWSAVLYARMDQAPRDAQVVYVVGKQWMWKIQHVEGKREINELHVPLGVPVRLVMTSQDVIHDFFLPAFRLKRDVLPGRYSSEWFQATRLGTFPIFCSQYCGTDHAEMTGVVVVMPPAAYARWLAQDGPSVPALASSALSDKHPPQPVNAVAQRGGVLFERLQCVECHGNPAVAPPLANLYGRPVALADGGTVTADEAYLYESIVQPQARIVRGYTAIMPSFEGQLSPDDVSALVEFIKTQTVDETVNPWHPFSPAAPPGRGRP